MNSRNVLAIGIITGIIFVFWSTAGQMRAQEGQGLVASKLALVEHLATLDQKTFASLEMSIGDCLKEMNESLLMAKFVNLLGSRGTSQSIEVLNEISPRLQQGKCKSLVRHAIRTINERSKIQENTDVIPKLSKESAITKLRDYKTKIEAMESSVENPKIQASINRIVNFFAAELDKNEENKVPGAQNDLGKRKEGTQH